MAQLRVAAVQVSSLNGRINRNLANAEKYVAEAAVAGARLILCPEFLAAGYIYDESIWQSAELAGGATETWLMQLANEYNVYVGATYLEAEGQDFYNTFALAASGLGIVGRVRKKSLPFFEGWYFRPCEESKIIETDIGRIGVGICNDCQTSWLYDHFREQKPDLILMPHSAPTPRLPVIGSLFRSAYANKLQSIATQYADRFGVPVVMANKAATQTSSPLPLVPLADVAFDFEGYSSVCDQRGRVLGSLKSKEGIIIGDVKPGWRDEEVASAEHFYWSFEPTVLPDTMGRLLQAFEVVGQASYRLNSSRKSAAELVSDQSKLAHFSLDSSDFATEVG